MARVPCPLKTIPVPAPLGPDYAFTLSVSFTPVPNGPGNATVAESWRLDPDAVERNSGQWLTA